jgi:formate dehydrogenase maturation protein FdhE
MESLKKIMLIAVLFIMQTPLISGPVQDLKDAAKEKIENAQKAAEEAVKREAMAINQEVSRTWAQWLIQKLGLDRAEQVAQVIDYVAAGAKKEISPEAAKKEKDKKNK